MPKPNRIEKLYAVLFSFIFLISGLSFSGIGQEVATKKKTFKGSWNDCPPSLDRDRILRDPFVRQALRKAMDMSKPDKTTQLKLNGLNSKVPLDFFHIPARQQHGLDQQSKVQQFYKDLKSAFRDKYGKDKEMPTCLASLANPNFWPAKNLGKQFLVNKNQVNEEKSTIGSREVAGFVLHERKKVSGGKKTAYKYRTVIYVYVPVEDFWNQVMAQTQGHRPSPSTLNLGKNRRIAAQFHTHPYYEDDVKRKKSKISGNQLQNRADSTNHVVNLDSTCVEVLQSVLDIPEKNLEDVPPWKPSHSDRSGRQSGPPGIIVGMKDGSLHYEPYGGNQKNPNPEWVPYEVQIKPDRNCLPTGRPVEIKACGALPDVEWEVTEGPGKIVRQFPNRGNHLIDPVAFYKAPEEPEEKNVKIKAKGSRGSSGSGRKNEEERTYHLASFEITPRPTVVYPGDVKTLYVRNIDDPVKWTVSGGAEVLFKKRQGDESSPPFVELKAPQKGTVTVKAKRKTDEESGESKTECNKDKLTFEVGNWFWNVEGPNHNERHVGTAGKAQDLFVGINNVLDWVPESALKKQGEKATEKIKNSSFWTVDFGDQQAYGKGISQGLLNRMKATKGSSRLPLMELQKQVSNSNPGNGLAFRSPEKFTGSTSSGFIGRLFSRNLANFHNGDNWRFSLTLEKVTEDRVTGSLSGWGACSEHMGRHLERLNKRIERAEENDNHEKADRLRKHKRRDTSGKIECGEVGLTLSGQFSVVNRTPQKDSPVKDAMPDSMENMKEMAEKMKERMQKNNGGKGAGDSGSGDQEASQPNGGDGAGASESAASSSKEKQATQSENQGRATAKTKNKPKDETGNWEHSVLEQDLSFTQMIGTHGGSAVYPTGSMRSRTFKLVQRSPDGSGNTLVKRQKPFTVGSILSDGDAILVGTGKKLLKITPEGSTSTLTENMSTGLMIDLYRHNGTLYVAGLRRLIRVDSGGHTSDVLRPGKDFKMSHGTIRGLFSHKDSLHLATSEGMLFEVQGKNLKNVQRLGVKITDAARAGSDLLIHTGDGRILRVQPGDGQLTKVAEGIEGGVKLAQTSDGIFVLQPDEERILFLKQK